MNEKLTKGALVIVTCLFGTYVYLNPPQDGEEEVKDCKSITMPKALVENMIENYKKNQLVAIENNTTNGVKSDAQSVWIDLNGLKEFIETIECKAPEGNKELGIRFFYTAYPDEASFGAAGYEDLKDVDKRYAKKHSLILIPTIKVDGVNTNFNPDETTEGTENKTVQVLMAKNHLGVEPL